MSAKADILMHPIRLRILTVLHGRQMTATQLASTMPDVPQSSLYRHINLLVEAGIMVVIDEKHVRGTLEKLYEVAENAGRLTPEDLADASKEELIHLFTMFTSTLLADFSRYLDKKGVQTALKEEKTLLSKSSVWLNDEEVKSLRELLEKYCTFEQAPDRQRYIWGTIFVPDVDAPQVDDENL